MAGDRTVVEGGGVVVVGVKLDSPSKELLTWALVKVAHPGDRVIALHVLDPTTETNSTLVSLVNTFDSLLAAYQGFCNLKQVDLKLKICRGSSVPKILVREAKCYGSANLVVGSSRSQHAIRSSVSVAKYCAKNLSKNFSVIAVDNGKILFKKEVLTVLYESQVKDWNDHYVRLHSLSQNPKGVSCDFNLSQLQSSNENDRITLPPVKRGELAESKSRWQPLRRSFFHHLSSNDHRNNSMALVPVNTRESLKSPPGGALLRGLWSRSRQQKERSLVKKTSDVQSLLRLLSRQSLAAVYPDQKYSIPEKNEFHSLKPDEENDSNDTVLPPYSYNHRPNRPAKELEGLHDQYSSRCRVFSYHELVLATSSFFSGNLVGRGGSSQVYRGCLPDGNEVAVKVMKQSEDALKQFISEIEIITTLKHKNVISLLGFCVDEIDILLVYNLLSSGSLEENLHGHQKDRTTLGWEDRFKVALGVAEALDYIHNGPVEPIIHRDVKSSNILLSENFEPQLSDFGLAISASNYSYHLSFSDIAGTFGYMAPEYFMHGKVTDKADVYAFGVVLLELLSGRRPIDNDYPKGQESLVTWAKAILKDGKFSELLDSSVGVDYDSDKIERMVLAATLCIKCEPSCRPQTSLILNLLQGNMDVIQWAREQANDTEEHHAVDGEPYPANIQSHMDLVLRDLEDEPLSQQYVAKVS